MTRHAMYSAILAPMFLWLLAGCDATRSPTDTSETATVSATSEPTGEKYVLAIEGMTCSGCVGSVTKAIKKVEGVASVAVSLEEKQAVIIASPEGLDQATVIAAVEEAGFKAAVPAADADTADSAEEEVEQ
jgi:copper chaperone